MIDRIIQSRLNLTLLERAAVVLLGPRQVGKTTLAQKLAESYDSTYLDLEKPSDLAKLSDPEFYFFENKERLIVIDEVQRSPDLFPVIRSQIDGNRKAGRRTGQFLLLGSASNELLKQSSESLAGRVSYQELFPFVLDEVGDDQRNQLWLKGGFPDSYLDSKGSFEWRLDFIRTYLERDIPALGVRVPAETLRRFWTMLAHNHSQLFNASQIGGSLGVKGQTASHYLDILVDLMLVRRLQPWHSNVGKRLIKSPKVYLRDSGVLHALLGLESMDALLGHPITGSSWEGFVIEQILAASPLATNHFFYRTRAGAEIDLLIETNNELWAIEIKRNMAPTVSRGFHTACEDLQPTHKRLIYPGDEGYTLKGDIRVSSLANILTEIRSITSKKPTSEVSD